MFKLVQDVHDIDDVSKKLSSWLQYVGAAALVPNWKQLS